MPFKRINDAQMRVCIGKSMDDIGKGKRPSWNCEVYACKPEATSSSEGKNNKEGGKSPMCNRIRQGGAIGSKIHQGPRGGYYFEIEEKKYYISSKNKDAMLKKFGVEKKPVRLSPYSKRTSPKRKSPQRKRMSGRKSPQRKRNSRGK